MIEQQLLAQIDRVTQRDRRLRLRRGLALGWASVAALGGVLFLLSNQQPWQFALAVPVLCIAAVIAWLLARHRADRACPTAIETARHIEARFPSLSARLLAAVEQVQSAPPQGLGYLQQTVIHQAVEHADQHDWRETVPSLALHRWTLARNVSAFALALVLIGLIIAAEPFAASPQAPTQLVIAPVDAKSNTLTVEPGNIAIERGTSLIVTARFSQFIPASTALILEGANPALGNAITTRTLPMTASLDDPLVGTRVPNVAADLAYRIIGDGVESQAYRVTVFDFPQLLQADATLRFPDYTGQSEKVIEDTRQVTAVEGTIVTWSLKLNKPIPSATLTAQTGDVVTLTASAASPTIVQGTMTLSQSQRYELALIDDAGRRNKHKVEFVVSVLKNRPPDLKLVFPKRDLRVSPIEEALVVAQAWDDFGLKAVGITYSLAGQNVTDTTLAQDVAGKSNKEVSQLLSFEAMNAQPDQLLSYHFWADDVGPDGKVRRTFSDMYFAEVRPFEEIFREGEAPPSSEQQQQQQQQQQGQQQQVGEGIKQQREIINATWNLIRRETGAMPTPTFAADAQVAREAQESALERMTQIKERLSDPQSLAHVEAVEKHMADAASHLAQAAENNVPAMLGVALPAEQAAYQALLKLQAREHEVIRAQQQRGQQSGQQQAGPSQQQLTELDLKNQENRYETQRMAQEQQEDPAQRETRQALNRLRDLAKRQQDLNEKLKELDLAMQEAKSQQEREELAQQLKRLREQQEEMLRDVDELRNRMEQANQQQEQRQQQGEETKQAEQKQQNQQAQNQQKRNERQQEAQDAKQQVDEVRQNVRQAAEALEQGLTSKALTEGTRAERKLEELRDEFRRKASGQFAEEVKEIRQDARELAQKQEDLGQKMEEADKAGPRSLRDKGERKELADALGDQKKKLEGLTDKMRKVTEDAEASQPLLSKQLYETLRNADQQQVDRALDVARELLDKGFNNEAANIEPQARKGINDLKKGVEKAAENVLGDETESIRRARQTLEDLAKEVERERGEEAGDAPGQQAMADAKSKRESGEGREPTKQGKGTGEKQPGQIDKAGGQPSQQKSDQPGKSGEGKSGKQPGQASGEKSEEKSGENAGEKSGNQPGDKAGKQSGKQNGKQPSSKPGQKGDGKGDGKSDGKGEPSGEQAGEQSGDGKGESQGGEQPGGKSGESQPSRTAQRPTKGNPSLLDQVRQGGATGGGSGPHGPITGEDFREWSDRLRDVEELIDDPNLREEVARIRDRAQAMRAEFKRHSKEPKWDDVRKLIAQPLTDLRDRLDDELARRDQKRDLVPIDRDPVPGQFTDIVRQYYEKLGAGEQPAEPATKQP